MTRAGAPPGPLASVAEAARVQRGLPPVHLWNPAHCGTIDIRIRGDGVWLHEGAPIARPELVRLFSTVLRKDADGYCLVTPVEKLLIRVDDLPFRAVAVDAAAGVLRFTTDVGDTVEAGTDRPIVVQTDVESGEPSPRFLVRGDLWARIARPVFYELVEMATLADGRLVVRSNGADFSLGTVGGDGA